MTSNTNRAKRARAAIRAYWGKRRTMHPDELPETVIDLLTDLTHLMGADAMRRAAQLAAMHHNSETKEEN
jgi:hypothetical protein